MWWQGITLLNKGRKNGPCVTYQMLLSVCDPQSIDSVLDTDTYCLWFSYDVNIPPDVQTNF